MNLKLRLSKQEERMKKEYLERKRKTDEFFEELANGKTIIMFEDYGEIKQNRYPKEDK